MSSELLLSARGIRKAYPSTAHPLAVLKAALFGSRQDEDEGYLVLEDIDLDVRRGETVGIMGRNGAGKTTLLGILGNVIQPTAGTVERSGRVATLLGLTAGFNVNFSGRENAYLFCSIQGLDRAATDARIDSIAAFADLGRFFDVPLRTYSSGMQARLAFACAIHVDADLIIIDETLAVGDANFRMKCYDRIRAMKESGQTFLLVSHNQNMVANFCTRGVVLEGGRKVFDGATFDAVDTYKRIRTEAMAGDDDLAVRHLRAGKPSAGPASPVTVEDLRLEADGGPDGESVIAGTLVCTGDVPHATLNWGITNQHGVAVCALDGERAGFVLSGLRAGDRHQVRMSFLRRLLPGRYFVSCVVHELVGDVARPLSLHQNFLSFDVYGNDAMTGLADLGMKVGLASAPPTPNP